MSIFLVGTGTAQDLSESKNSGPVFGTARKGSFDILLSTTGEAESADKVEIKCQTTSVVLEMVPEGTNVKSGDFLVRLSNTELENKWNTQKIAILQAQTDLISAEVRKRSATAALKGYEEGSYVQEEQSLLQKIAIAEKYLELNREEYAAAEYAGKTGLELKRLAVQLEESKLDVDLLNRQLRVLQDISKETRKIELKGDLEAAEVAASNANEKLRMLTSRLEDLEQQLQACTILAPDSFEGKVCYAQAMTADGQAKPIDVGSQVYEGQSIAYVPASDKMNVIVQLPQAEAFRVRPMMRARIRIFDQKYDGFVRSIVGLQSRWLPTGDNQGLGIFTLEVIDPPNFFWQGMSVDVTIKIGEVRDKVYLPVQAIFNHDGHPYCCIQTDEGIYETRRLTIGMANGSFAEIITGVAEGDLYLTQPDRWLDVLDLPSINGPSPDEDFSRPFPVVDQPDSGQGRQGNTNRQENSPGGSMNPEYLVKQILNRSDRNGDGMIDKDELDQVNDQTRQMLGRADADGDGKITQKELRKSMGEMMRRMQGQGGGGGPRGGGTGGSNK